MKSACVALLVALGCGPAPFRPPTYEAEPEPPPPAPEPEARPEPIPLVATQPFLWRVRRGRAVSHVFGTIHAGVSLDDAFPAAAFADLDAARQVFLEVDPTRLTTEALREAARLPEGQTLETFFTASVWHRLANELHTHTNTDQLEVLRPWVPMLMLVQHRVAALGGRTPDRSMDSVLAEYVADRELPFEFLETSAEQFDALAQLPDRAVVEQVTGMLDAPAESERRSRRVVEAYRGAQAAAVARVATDDTTRVLAAVLLDGGQAQWLTRLRAELDQGGGLRRGGRGPPGRPTRTPRAARAGWLRRRALTHRSPRRRVVVCPERI